MMEMPNGLVSFNMISGNINSDQYIRDRSIYFAHNVVPIIKLNYSKNWYLQKPNAPVYKSNRVEDFRMKSRISVLAWPAKSPDLNIVEHCWKNISDLVYDSKNSDVRLIWCKKLLL